PRPPRVQPLSPPGTRLQIGEAPGGACAPPGAPSVSVSFPPPPAGGALATAALSQPALPLELEGEAGPHFRHRVVFDAITVRMGRIVAAAVHVMAGQVQAHVPRDGEQHPGRSDPVHRVVLVPSVAAGT